MPGISAFANASTVRSLALFNLLVISARAACFSASRLAAAASAAALAAASAAAFTAASPAAALTKALPFNEAEAFA